jgi:branched-chain amino acid transport system ATP-binding protein
MTSTSTVLRAGGVSVSFGGVHALADVSLEVGEGQLVGLIGPNGAGKTTFIDAISGFVRCQGKIELAGRDLSAAPPHARARHGLARTWQSTELFDDLTVEENLAVAAAQRQSVWSTVKETLTVSARTPPAVRETARAFGLEPLMDTLATELPQGKRKLIGIARAFAARPKLVCLDEPAAGLGSEESEELGRRLRGIVDTGTSLLLVDHDMGLVLSVCDHVVVLDFGKVIAQGPPEAVRKDPKVITAYLGSAAAEVVDGGARP